MTEKVTLSKELKEVREWATCVSEEGTFQIKALIKGEFYKLGLGLVEAFLSTEGWGWGAGSEEAL